MIRAAQARALRKRYRQIAPVLNEQSRRRFVALEAQALGRGGVSFMARMTGLARSTIYHGLCDIRHHVATAPGRIRKNGSGRKKKVLEDPTLLADLAKLVEPATRGDPMHPLLWTSRSLRNLVKELAKKRHRVCPTVVGNLLRELGYSLQANAKTREGGKHIDRDAQFRYINTQATAFLSAGQPVISVDTKKKEPCLSGCHPHPLLVVVCADSAWRGLHGHSEAKRCPVSAIASRVPAAVPRQCRMCRLPGKGAVA
jgi:hypothetical protein